MPASALTVVCVGLRWFAVGFPAVASRVRRVDRLAVGFVVGVSRVYALVVFLAVSGCPFTTLCGCGCGQRAAALTVLVPVTLCPFDCFVLSPVRGLGLFRPFGAFTVCAPAPTFTPLGGFAFRVGFRLGRLTRRRG